MNNELTKIETDRLAELEEIIEKGLKTFTHVGKSLIEIRDSKLYKEEYSTFNSYCKERWGMVKTQANRLISASNVVDNLTPMGVILPTNERQVRPMTKLEPEQQAVAWDKAVEVSEGNVPTAKVVQEVVKDMTAVERVTPPPLEGTYQVIYADPPWRYDFSMTDNRKIENQYPTMSLDAYLGYAQDFSHEIYKRLYFVVHSPDRNLLTHQSEEIGVELIIPKRLANMVVDLGLVSWLLKKIN